jgi:hypothetical protein
MGSLIRKLWESAKKGLVAPDPTVGALLPRTGDVHSVTWSTCRSEHVVLRRLSLPAGYFATQPRAEATLRVA